MSTQWFSRFIATTVFSKHHGLLNVPSSATLTDSKTFKSASKEITQSNPVAFSFHDSKSKSMR